MALFRYKALSEKGRTVRGLIDAESLQEAKQKLVRRQILITEVNSLREEGRSSRVSKQELLVLTKELSRLLQAGLPLFDSLTALEEKYRKHRAHELLLDLCDTLRAGRSLSEALSRHPQAFDLLYRSMIANAEQSGQMIKALEELSRLMERQIKLKGQIVAALLYPALLGGFCILVFLVLLLFVVPSLAELFEGRSLHPLTRFVFACSHMVREGKWYFASLFCGVVCAVIGAFSSLKVRDVLRKKFAEVFLWKELFAKVSLTRWFRAVAALLEGGLPALEALRESKGVLRHSILERSVDEVLLRLAEGASLQEALENRLLIPALVPRMLGIAQASGNLASMMHQIASIYEEDLEKSFSRLTAFAQPILLLILGGVIGFVLLSVLLPLTDVNSFST